MISAHFLVMRSNIFCHTAFSARPRAPTAKYREVFTQFHKLFTPVTDSHETSINPDLFNPFETCIRSSQPFGRQEGFRCISLW